MTRAVPACHARPMLRFAPSPTGRLHLGHAYSALLNEHVARALGGTWLLRIEDIDPVRASPAHAAGIERDLAWLGLSWARPVRWQSAHLAEYREGAERLRDAGLLYPCFCTRRDIARAVLARDTAAQGWPRDPDGTPLYPGTCRVLPDSKARARMAAREPYALRLDMVRALAASGPVAWRRFDPPERGTQSVVADPLRWGDVVVVRKDVPTSYHLSVVLDDAAQGITHVVRGRDLEAATDVHAVLAACLGLDLPVYHHHRLLADSGGLKLSKSRGSASLEALRAAGTTPGDVRRGLGFAPDPVDGDGALVAAPRTA